MLKILLSGWNLRFASLNGSETLLTSATTSIVFKSSVSRVEVSPIIPTIAEFSPYCNDGQSPYPPVALKVRLPRFVLRFVLELQSFFISPFLPYYILPTIVYRQATTNAVAYHILLLFLTYVKRCDKIRLCRQNAELYGRKIYERGTRSTSNSQK